MQENTFTASDGQSIVWYETAPAGEPRAVVHIAHGMGEHAARYEWTMAGLAGAGYHVIAHDHRAHGKTADVLGDFGPDGVNAALRDMNELVLASRERFPGKPVILFGHSMGAMFSQMYITRYGDSLDALILSGSPSAGHPFQLWLVHTIARFERWRTGGLKESDLLQTLLFGSANKNFEDTPNATGFEWLSRDAAQVAAYVKDPMCGFVPCPRSVCDLFAEERAAGRPEAVSAIPRSLPVYFFLGTADPVNNELKNTKRLLARYRDHGLTVSTRYYEEGRHEMLNEINRDEVLKGVIDWLETQLA